MDDRADVTLPKMILVWFRRPHRQCVKFFSLLGWHRIPKKKCGQSHKNPKLTFEFRWLWIRARIHKYTTVMPFGGRNRRQNWLRLLHTVQYPTYRHYGNVPVYTYLFDSTVSHQFVQSLKIALQELSARIVSCSQNTCLRDGILLSPNRD